MEHLTDLALARALASAAASLLRAGKGRAHTAERKQAHIDLVTEYDRRSEALIVEGLRRARPNDQILGEEGGSYGNPGQGRRWLIDPLDGTTNFTHGLPFFCVSIGLEEAGTPRVGVVAAPALDMTFFAELGGGAFLEERGEVRRIDVSTTATLSESLLATGFPYDRQVSPQNNFAEFVWMKRRVQGVRRFGAAALDLAMVAAGWLDGYWEMKLKPWDLAAGILLVTEAGGTVTDWRGATVVLDRGEVVASNGRIQNALIAELQAPKIPV
jgi:myo-inositol-1(or 4)-monophosphatase